MYSIIINIAPDVYTNTNTCTLIQYLVTYDASYSKYIYYAILFDFIIDKQVIYYLSILLYYYS